MKGSARKGGILPEPLPYGSFLLLEKISAGGMAEVFKAKSFGVDGFERFVAVKRIRPAIAEDEEFIRMFVNEAKLASQLQHANIAQIFELGRVDESYFIAMEYVPGLDAREMWQRMRDAGEKIPVDIAASLVQRVCEGLDFAHNKADAAGRPLGIVHRDVSPQNIILSFDGEVKLVDFGVAKAATSSGHTQVGIVKGKLSYMSPEQVRGLPADRRSDTFAAGIVLYELLTGERLFLGATDFDTLERIRKHEVVPPSLYNPEIPAELESIMLRTLAVEPEERYQSAFDLGLALQQFLQSRGVVAPSRALREWVSSRFAEDLMEERRRNELFLTASPSPEVTLSWDDEESETQVFGKEPDVVDADEVATFIPPAEDVVWAKPPRSSRPSGALPAVGDPPRPTLGGPLPSAATATGFEDAGPTNVSAAQDTGIRERPSDDPAPLPPLRSKASTPTPPKRTPAGLAAASDAGSDPAAPSASPPVVAARPARTRVEESRDATGAIARVPARSRTPLIAALLFLTIAGALIAAFLFRPAPAPETGMLVGAIEPGNVEVRVLLDDDEMSLVRGRLRLDGLIPRFYTVRLEADGFLPVEEGIRIPAGGSVERAWQLQPAHARVVVSVPDVPEARVWIAGEDRGMAPVTVAELGRGERVQVRVEAEGFLRWEEELLLEDEEVALRPELRPATRTLRLESATQGARFELRDPEGEVVATGALPETVEDLRSDRRYALRISADGHEDREENVAPGELDSDTLRIAALRQDARQPAEERPVPAREAAREAAPTPAPAARPAAPRETAPTPPPAPAPRQAAAPQAPTPEPARTPPPAPAPRAERAPTPPPAPAPAPSAGQDAGPPAMLTIQSRPQAEIWIDGRNTGQSTPVNDMQLAAGSYRIQLVNESAGFDRTYRVRLQPGQRRTIIGMPD